MADDIKEPGLTEEQGKARDSKGNIIVSASAGSGKTTTMIERIIRVICDAGSEEKADLDSILAVTFTEKAAASMKRKLRNAILKNIQTAGSDEERKDKLKEQLDKIPAADISTIHAFCAHLIRRYFYLAGCDANFDILADDTARKEVQVRAMDRLFDKLYLQKDPDLDPLLKYYSSKQDDSKVRELVADVYDEIRVVADYREELDKKAARQPEAVFADALISLYGKSPKINLVKNTEEFRNAVAGGEDAAEVLKAYENEFANLHDGGVYQELLDRIDAFEKDFITSDMYGLDTYENIINESRATVTAAFQAVSSDADLSSDLAFCDAKQPGTVNKVNLTYKLFNTKLFTQKEAPTKNDKAAVKAFTGKISGEFAVEYNQACVHIVNVRTALKLYYDFRQSVDIARAFTNVLKQYDREYAAIKKELNVLDYNDLEHYALDLMRRPEVKKDVAGKYRMAFVDEYQDVNPVQNMIISSICEPDDESSDVKCFYVGDEKQAIYGFRGSSSGFFKKTAQRFKDKADASDEYHSLYMNDNFRSAHEIITEVNRIFSGTMTPKVHDVNYEETSCMAAHDEHDDAHGEPGTYVESGVVLVVFGAKDAKEKAEELYSVKEASTGKKISREGLAAVKLVQSCIGKERYEPAAGKWVETTPGDICVLSRTWKGTEGVAHALSEYGYQVSGAQDENICDTPEVCQMLDILSYIDNPNQDIPLVSALLSPIGGFSEDDLAGIRIASGFYDAAGKDENGYSRKLSFRECCEGYKGDADLKGKLDSFFSRMEDLRKSAVILSAGAVIEKILGDYDFEGGYGPDSAEALNNINFLAKEGADITIPAFLKKIKSAGNEIKRPASASSDSIQVMTMHASKGLEFPIVIITDICKTPKGSSTAILFSEENGLAPYSYDDASMTRRDTVLSKLVSDTADREDKKNDLNLFYVACTRAKSKLYIMTEKTPEYSEQNALKYKSFSNIINFGLDDEACKIHITDYSDMSTAELLGSVSKAQQTGQETRAEKPSYAYSCDTTIPAKSSASAMVRAAEEEDDEAGTTDAFVREKEDIQSTEDRDGHAAERGTAYHRFLELCDFSIKDEAGIQKELDGFISIGLMSAEEAGYLNAQHLKEIVCMDVFKCFEGAEDVRREQSFYCPIPAKEFMSGTESEDEVIIQGAMDLLVKRDGLWQIIDYKYSDKSEDEIKAYYAPQIRVYRQVLSKITGQAVDDIPATIVNIKNHFTVRM